jgi:hypothetical protein
MIAIKASQPQLKYQPQMMCIKPRRVLIKTKSSYDVLPALIGSAAAYTSTYPIDTIKTRLQANNEECVPMNKLYAGYIHGVFLCMASASTYFVMYNYLLSIFGNDKLVICSMVATFISCFVKVPGKSIVKVMQNEGMYKIEDAMNHIKKNFGVYGFYRGFWIYVVDDVPENAMKFLLYEVLQKFITVNWIIGAVAGFLTSVMTQPFDVLQTKIICDEKKCPELKLQDSFKGLGIKLLIETIQSAIFYRCFKFIIAINMK